jgi:two-component system chemotaxis response regulator CheY
MKTSLVVDDSRVVRSVCRKIMEEMDFTVTEAEDGQQALMLCDDLKPDVILLDWNMPVMDGLEFLRAFREIPGNEASKVIFCTTENDVQKIQTVMQAGADEYVMKPFDSEIIQGKLQQLGLI